MCKKVIATLQSIVKTEVISIWIENRSLATSSKLVPMAVIGYLKCRELGVSMKPYRACMTFSSNEMLIYFGLNFIVPGSFMSSSACLLLIVL